ncbi:hypothetical protein IAD21_02481 [Abditibacteriota bacterium]|nr:hypothetical protein IAD21_02481 [Abditibacteriota bacterium]
MQKPFIFGALALASFASAVHADVTWEHTASVSMGTSKPITLFNIRNDWSGDNHRARISFDVSKMAAAAGNMAGGMSGGPPPSGTVDIIERLGDDRLIFALRNPTNTAVTQYLEEPYSTLQSRLRINFFQALDPKFAKDAEPVPALTDEQRRRLGQELRAYTKPLTQAVSRQYFRALPEKRVINGLESRGYRYTSMTKVPDSMGSKGQWVRMASELWIASGQSGDDEILSFTKRANELKSGAPTVSMWINEIMPILAETAPNESQAFIAALIGRKGDANYGFKGTPTQIFLTVSPPPAEQLVTGEIRLQLNLKRRADAPIPMRAFASPTTGERTKIEPFLAIMRNLVKEGRDKIEKSMGDML